MKNRPNPHKAKRNIVRNFGQDTEGNVAIIFAFLMPISIAGFLFAHDINMQTAENEFARTVAQAACNRVVKSSITQYPSFEAKESAGVVTLKNAYDERKSIKNVSYDINLVEHDAEVTVKAELNTLLNLNNVAMSNVEVNVDCSGIPPYPRIDEVVYEGNFGQSITEETPYTYQSRDQCWGRIDAEKVGWNFAPTLGSTVTTEHCGLEIQDWVCGQYFIPRNAKDKSHDLPIESSDGLVVELDGNCNTAINKPLELHPGTYEFSIWYRGRSKFSQSDRLDTNDIGMYLQKANQATLEPLETLTEEHKIISMSDPDSISWREYTYTIEVPDYDIYIVTMMGEGRNDSFGGLFTSFDLTYKELKK